MNISEIKKLLKNPLVGALLSDFAVVGGFDILKRVLNPKEALEQASKNPPKIPKVFLQLTAAQRLTIAPWFETVSHRDRRKIEELEEATIKELFELPEIEKNAFLSILPDSPMETIRKLLAKIEVSAPSLPKTAQLIKDFGDWGRTL